MLERFILLRKSLNLSQKELAHIIGVTPTTICDIEKNRCPITERTIISICAKLNINENWLRTGEGEMINTIDKKFNEFFEIYNKLSLPLQQFLLNTAIELLNLQNKL